MSLIVSLSDIIQALDFSGSEHSHYLDKKTGNVIMITEEDMSLGETLIEDGSVIGVEEIDFIPDWQRENVEFAIRILNEDKDIIILPDQFDINERAIMFDFVMSLEDQEIRLALLEKLNRPKPYRDCCRKPYFL